jgi:hypothetical protein
VVNSLEPVSFAYKVGDGRTRYGFIAEDTAAIDPHLTTYDASGTVSGIDDRSLLAILVGALKKLYAQAQDYFARTERLEERVSALEAQLATAGSAGAPTEGEAPALEPGLAVGADSGPEVIPPEHDSPATTTAATSSAPAVPLEAENDNSPTNPVPATGTE